MLKNKFVSYALIVAFLALNMGIIHAQSLEIVRLKQDLARAAAPTR